MVPAYRAITPVEQLAIMLASLKIVVGASELLNCVATDGKTVMGPVSQLPA